MAMSSSSSSPSETRPSSAMGHRVASKPIAYICVYCGASDGNRPEFEASAKELARLMVDANVGLVYGGGNTGLMGIIANEVMRHGGEVVGVITEQLQGAEVAHHGITRLEIVKTMHERKARMNELSQGFVAMPGGFGTVEELAEITTWNQLGIIKKPLVLFNVLEYWSLYVEFLKSSMLRFGFARPQHQVIVQLAASAQEALTRALAPAPTVPPKN